MCFHKSVDRSNVLYMKVTEEMLPLNWRTLVDSNVAFTLSLLLDRTKLRIVKISLPFIFTLRNITTQFYKIILKVETQYNSHVWLHLSFTKKCNLST